MKGGSLYGAEPSRTPRVERSGDRSSENDRLVWPSTARGKPRNCEQGTVFDLDTTPSDTSDSSRENSDGNYKTDSTEADANGLARLNEVREDISQITHDSAFPYADSDEEVYMAPPPGMDLQEWLLFETGQKSVRT